MFTRNFDLMQLNMNLNLTDNASVTISSNGTSCPNWNTDANYNVIKGINTSFNNLGTTPYYTKLAMSLSSTYSTGFALAGESYMFSLINFSNMTGSVNAGSSTYYYNGCGFGTNSSAESYDDYRIDMIPNNSTNGLYFSTPTVTFTTENGKKYANITINANNRTGSDLSISEFGIYTTRPTYLSSTSSRTSLYILLYRKVFSAVTIQAGANFEFKDKIELKDYEGSNIGVSPSCVLTRNYYKMLDFFTYRQGNYGTISTAPTEAQWTSSDDYDCVKALGVSGTSTGVNGYKYQWISKYNVSYGSSNYTSMYYLLTNNFNLILGSNSTTPTYNDADLGSRLVTYNTAGYYALPSWNTYKYSQSVSSSKSISGDTMTYTRTYTITNTSDSNITIREYGLYNYYGTKSQYDSYFLTLRGVLPSDVVLEPNAVTTITLTFTIPIRPNKPTT